MTTVKDKEYLDAAADSVSRQLEENPGIGIPVDPDVADHMGAFEEDAMSLGDAIEGSEELNEAD